MSKLGEALKGVVSPSGWKNFPRDLKDDLSSLGGNWPAGTTLQYKNEYRARVMAVCAAGAIPAFMVWWVLGVALAGIAVWKAKIIQTDN